MAGAGYKLFQTGDVLTAAQVNTYLNEQTVMVFANAAARTSALTSVLAEGMVSYLQDTNAVEVYNGSAWVGVSGAGDVTEVQAGTGISVASGTGPIPVVTNTMATAIDAEGDLIIGDAADAFQRLAIGSNTHVLTVDTSVDGKIKWAAPASGLTKIATGTFSNVATVDIDSVFSTTYKNYLVTLKTSSGGTGNDDLQLQWRTSSTTETTSNYYGSYYEYDRFNTLVTSGYGPTAQLLLCNSVGSPTSDDTQLSFYVSNVGASFHSSCVWGQGINKKQSQAVFGFAGLFYSTGTYLGFRLKSSSANITGSYQVYGLAE